MRIPWPGMALNTAKGIKSSNRHQIMVKCFHDSRKVEKSSAFIFYSSMKAFGNSTVGNTVLRVFSCHW